MNPETKFSANGTAGMDSHQAAPNILDPKKLGSAIWRRKFLVVFIFMLGVGGTAYYTSKLTKAYGGVASVMMENPVNLDREQVPAEFRVTDAYRVLARTLLRRAEEISGEQFGYDASYDAKVEEQMLSFSVIADTPERAAKLANGWAEAFVEKMKSRNKASGEILRTHLSRMMANAQEDLRDHEKALKTFEGKFDQGQHDRLLAQINLLEEQKRAKQLEIDRLSEDKERSEARAQAPLDLTHPDMAVYARLLEDFNRRLDERKRTFKEENDPEIKWLIKQIETTKAAAKETIATAAISKGLEVDLAQKVLFRIKRKIDDERLNLNIITTDAPVEKRQELLKNVADSRRAVDDLKQRISILDDRLDLVYSYATHCAHAFPNTAPVRPNWKKNVAAGMFASLIAALLLVMALEFMDRTVKTASDMESNVSGSIIGFIPRFKTAEAGPRELSTLQNSFAADSLRNLQVRLDMNLGARQPGNASVLVVTSPLPAEGKSFLSSNIASFFAAAGKSVLLIDADFRKAMLSATHRCKGKPGLGDALVSGKWNRDMVMKTDVSGCSFLPSGTQGEKGLRHLSQAAMEDLLSKIRVDYDVIIIDTAPVLAMADVCILARLADATLLVVRSRRSKLVHVQRATKQLKDADVKSLSVVINAVEAADAKGEDYYFAAGGYGYERAEVHHSKEAT